MNVFFKIVVVHRFVKVGYLIVGNSILRSVFSLWSVFMRDHLQIKGVCACSNRQWLPWREPPRERSNLPCCMSLLFPPPSCIDQLQKLNAQTVALGCLFHEALWRFYRRAVCARALLLLLSPGKGPPRSASKSGPRHCRRCTLDRYAPPNSALPSFL